MYRREWWHTPAGSGFCIQEYGRGVQPLNGRGAKASDKEMRANSKKVVVTGR